MARKHDAELCDRIRALEERVRELEARPSQTIVYQAWYQPWWTSTPTIWQSPNISVGGYFTTDGTSDAFSTLQVTGD